MATINCVSVVQFRSLYTHNYFELLGFWTCPSSSILNWICFGKHTFFNAQMKKWRGTYLSGGVTKSYHWSLTTKPNYFQSTVLGGIILHDFFLRDFALMRLENIHQLNMIWHERSVATLIFFRRPSITCLDWLCWSYNHKDTLVSSSTTLAFLTNISEKHKSTSPSAIWVKNQWQPMSTEEKLDKLSRLEKGEWTVDRIKESATCLGNIIWQQCETGSVCVTILPQSYQNELCQKLKMWGSYIFITLEMYVYCTEMSTDCIYSTYIISRSVCPSVL
jgi:hypothetical protein